MNAVISRRKPALKGGAGAAQAASAWLGRALSIMGHFRAPKRVPLVELERHLFTALASRRPGNDARLRQILREILHYERPGMAQLFAFCAENPTFTPRIMHLLSGIAQDRHDPVYNAAVSILRYHALVSTRSS